MSESEEKIFRFRLFVAGGERPSRAAREHLGRICREHLGGRCHVEIVDVLEDYSRALKEKVLVTPTLFVLTVSPPAVFVGDLSRSTDQLLRVLFENGPSDGDVD